MGVWMKAMVLVLVLAAAAFSWTNGAAPALMDAQYEYAACNVQFAKGWLAMREKCALVHEVPALDSKEYIADMDKALGNAREAADNGGEAEFGVAMWGLRGRMLSLGLAILGDAFLNKSMAFRSCVLDGAEPLKEELKECRGDAMEKGKAAAIDYVNNEIEYANSQIAELDAMGANTIGMRKIVDYGEELVADIGPAFDAGDGKYAANLYLRHSRLILLFRLEKMMAIMDYAEPIIEAGSNRNKEELLEKIADLKGDTEDLSEECAYSETVDSGYGLENAKCWNEGLALMARFNALQVLYWEGR